MNPDPLLSFEENCIRADRIRAIHEFESRMEAYQMAAEPILKEMARIRSLWTQPCMIVSPDFESTVFGEKWDEIAKEHYDTLESTVGMLRRYYLPESPLGPSAEAKS